MPISPLDFAVRVSVAPLAVALTGRSASLTAVCSLAAISAALCPAAAATLTVVPPAETSTDDAVCTVPLNVMLPVAATPALWSGRPITVKSK